MTAVGGGAVRNIQVARQDIDNALNELRMADEPVSFLMEVMPYLEELRHNGLVSADPPNCHNDSKYAGVALS